MNFLATLRIALLALRVNKMRSALTMLGIIIGVAAVIIMIAVGGKVGFTTAPQHGVSLRASGYLQHNLLHTGTGRDREQVAESAAI